MAVWHLTVNVKAPWEDDSLDFPEKVEKIVGIIKNSRWRAITDDTEEFDSLVQELENSDSVSEFDYVWNSLYDLADADRVWLATF